MGAQEALGDVRRRLDVTRLDQPRLDDSLAEAYRRAAGYRLVRWRGAAPEEYVADVAYLEGRLLIDAPLGDLEWEPEQVDAERIRGTEGRSRRGAAAVPPRRACTRRPAGWSPGHCSTWAPTADWHAWQQITLVDPAHRGHRLGLLVKIENLRYVLAHEPALRAIDTWNAASNSYMIAINEQLGFRPVDAWSTGS